MSKKDESQRLRDAPVAGTSAASTWDPYEVWLDRVKKPRDALGAPLQTTIKLAGPEITETARLRALTAPLSR